METLFRASLRLLPVSAAVTCRAIRFPVSRPSSSHFLNHGLYKFSSSSSSVKTNAGWLLGLGDKKKQTNLPDIVAAGDPVLHEKAREVDPEEIGSERIQKIIDDMVKVMRLAPGVGLAAPQIGIPLRIIVLEDTKEYISYAPEDEVLAQERRPFDLLVMVNPELKGVSDKKALFFEGCLSVDGFRGAVERYLEVEVTGYDRQGKRIQIIVLEDTKEYISYAPEDEVLAQERRPFDLLVMVNPELKGVSDKKALFFEGCLSVDGFRGAVERYLEVEVTGYDRQGKRIQVNAHGWQARILQHECDHLDGNLYVDKMIPRTFRTVDNLDLPLAEGCPKLGPQ